MFTCYAKYLVLLLLPFVHIMYLATILMQGNPAVFHDIGLYVMFFRASRVGLLTIIARFLPTKGLY